MTQQDRTAVQYHKMTETPIPRLILSLAAPTILSMLITSIYNLADTFFVGRISTSASGAVGVVSSLMAIIQALGFMLGHGSGTIISRRLGSQDTHAATRFASTSFFTALAFGVVLAVVGLATLPDFMMLLGSTKTILPHACAYARPILLAAPLMISSLVMNNILRYEGKANLAMVGLVTGGLLNIALDPLFMFALGLGTAGAGIATALSQTISFGILLYMFLRGKTVSQFRLSAVTREPREFLQILAGGAPSFGRQGLNSIGGMLLEGIGDTIRVSLAAEPEKEVEAGFNILRAVGFPVTGPEVITCPTCGRTQYPCTEIANEVEKRLQGYKKSIKVAVMGCVVNGPGEAREADIGIAGGKGEAVLFIHGKPIKKLTGDNILDQFMDEIYKL